MSEASSGRRWLSAMTQEPAWCAGAQLLGVEPTVDGYEGHADLVRSAHQRAIAEPVGRNVQERREVHRSQSDAGMGLGLFTASGTPPTAREPFPGLVHNSSTLPSAVT